MGNPVSAMAFRPLQELVDEADQRLADVEGGSLERLAGKLIADVNNFKQHVARFIQTMPKYQGWSQQLVGISPVLDLDQRAALTRHDIIPQDLNDLTHGLG
jgi:hypothetical protein